MIACAEAVRQLWEYLDGTVDPSQRATIEEHLSFCRRCCGEVQFAEELRGFLTANAEEALPPDVQARLLASIDSLDAA